jgi:hypothetical protein
MQTVGGKLLKWKHNINYCKEELKSSSENY